MRGVPAPSLATPEAGIDVAAVLPRRCRVENQLVKLRGVAVRPDREAAHVPPVGVERLADPIRVVLLVKRVLRVSADVGGAIATPPDRSRGGQRRRAPSTASRRESFVPPC